MEQIYPLKEDVIQHFCGMPVCAVLNDGTRHVGVLSYCRDGKLMLNDRSASGGNEAELKKVKSKKQRAGKKVKKAQAEEQEAVPTQSSYPFNPYDYAFSHSPFGGGPIALDMARVSFLFLLL
ncbi:hypothetical protein [Paenibacillus sp. NEAU-GSW1]|uniref:hypothetical protein n=1 Tax=Paenibacillus sp. NEAU-GSW1 TaxID=2682486 RepID=UPI0012E2F27C|nr:hypothetical protein [Paenibacillus sp. NEAU-GSW1]MUT68664.1 hypothetical protein [Paenibacillus sp. NEAU-GSW1]